MLIRTGFQEKALAHLLCHFLLFVDFQRVTSNDIYEHSFKGTQKLSLVFVSRNYVKFWIKNPFFFVNNF